MKERLRWFVVRVAPLSCGDGGLKVVEEGERRFEGGEGFSFGVSWCAMVSGLWDGDEVKVSCCGGAPAMRDDGGGFGWSGGGSEGVRRGFFCEGLRK